MVICQLHTVMWIICSRCALLLLFVHTGAQPPEGERKLFLLIEAPTEAMVRRAKQEIRRVIEELVEKAMRRDVGAGQRGRYNVM